MTNATFHMKHRQRVRNAAMAKPRSQRETSLPRAVEMPTLPTTSTLHPLNARWPSRRSVEMQGFPRRLERPSRLATARMARMVMWSYILYISTLWTKYPTSIECERCRDVGRDARNSRRLYLLPRIRSQRFPRIFSRSGGHLAAGVDRSRDVCYALGRSGRGDPHLCPRTDRKVAVRPPRQGGTPRVAGATVRVQRWIAAERNV